MKTTTLHYTEEQSNIINLELIKFKILIIQALAGTGKTTTLLEIISHNQNSNFLYLAFNNKIVEEIKKKTSFNENYKNVLPKTIHSFAFDFTKDFFNSLNKRFEEKLTFDLIKEVLPTLKTFEVYSIIKWFNLYTNQELNIKEYIKFISKLNSKQRFELQIHERKDYILKILKYVETLYLSIIEGDSKFYTHNTYLKYFIDNMEKFDYDKFDVLLVDEAQDLNPIMLKLVYTFINKGKKFIGVGDDNQSIYSFINNLNLLKDIQKQYRDIKVMTLSYSFRFKEDSLMEKYANLILNYRNKNIKGIAIYEDNTINDQLLLGRSNSQVFWSAFQLSQQKRHFLLLGGISKELQTFFEDINNILYKKTNLIKSKLFLEFSDIKELKSFAQREHDQEILSAITLLSKLKEEKITLFSFFKDIKKYNKNKFFILARPNPTYLSTIHKAKGLEFDEVEMLPKITDNISLFGFKYNIMIKEKILLKIMPNQQITEEYNLLYVAVTRAKKSLNIFNEEILINLKFLSSKMNYHKEVEINDTTLQTLNSKFEYVTNIFIEIKIDNYIFLINKEEFKNFKEILSV